MLSAMSRRPDTMAEAVENLNVSCRTLVRVVHEAVLVTVDEVRAFILRARRGQLDDADKALIAYVFAAEMALASVCLLIIGTR